MKMQDNINRKGITESQNTVLPADLVYQNDEQIKQHQFHTKVV